MTDAESLAGAGAGPSGVAPLAVTLGLATADGYVRTWSAHAPQDWRCANVEGLLAALGQGRLSRTVSENGTCFEAATVDPDGDVLLLSNQAEAVRDTGAAGSLEPVRLALERVAGPPLWTEESLAGFNAWLRLTLIDAAARGEGVVVLQAPHGGQQPRAEFFAAHVEDGTWVATVSADPRQAPHPVWDRSDDDGTLRMVATATTIAMAADLITEAVLGWPGSPLDNVIGYRPAPDGPFDPTEADLVRDASAPTRRQARIEGRSGDLAVVGALTGPLTYALAHNRVPLFEALEFGNLGAGDLGQLAVEINIESELPAPPMQPIHFELEAPGPGDFVAVRLPQTPDPAVLVGVDERVGAQLHVTVTSSAGPFLDLREPIDVLAYNQWTSAVVSSLAAFVLPRHPAVREVLSDASDLLAAATGSPSLEGYQSGPERADQIARAAYEALATRGIRYSNPPASFEKGQKIRTPEEVLDDRFGTCLDTTVLYAACLEEAGLHPVIFVADGHAFSGYLRQEGQLAQPVVTDTNTMVNLVETRRVVPVETTTLTTGNNHLDFDGAEASARSVVTTETERLRCLVDVSQNRTSVRPLPSRRRVGDVIEVHADPGPRRDTAVPRAEHAGSQAAVVPVSNPTDALITPGTRQVDTSPPRVQQWKTALLDLSLRNPLLNFKPGRSGLDLHVPSGALPRFEDLVASGHRIKLFPSDQLQDVHRLAGIRAAQELDVDTLTGYLFDQRAMFTALDEREYFSRLRMLRRKARALEEETGANHLFLTLGELRWNESVDGRGRELRSPLLLLPMRLDGGIKGKPLFNTHIEEGAYASPNFSMLKKLSLSFGVEIPTLETPLTDAAGVDIDAVFDAVRQAIADADLPFRVDEACHLGLLAFTNFRLWKDLDEHHQTFLRNPVVRHLVESPTEPFVDADGLQDIVADELDLLCPVAADGSQMNAIAWGLAGRSFVLEGPPGTGKSQTITNLIANLLIRGKKVLFVAEKSAALDVVQRRLDAVGLGTACLNLHGKDQAPAGVRAQIKAALDLQVDSNDQLWQVSNTRMAAAVRQLAGYPPGIHSPNVAGLTAWTAHQAILALSDGPVAQIPNSFITTHGGRAGEIRDKLAELPSVVNAAGDVAHHPWRVARAGSEDLPQSAVLVDALMAVRAALERLRGDAAALEPLWSTAPDLAVLSAIERAAAPLAAGGIPRLEVLQAASQPGWEASVLQVEGLLAAYRSEPTPTHTMFATSIFGVDLERFLAEARVAASKMLGRKRRLGVIVSELQPHVRAQLSLADADLVALLSATLAERHRTRALNAQAQALPSIALPDGWSCTQSDADRTFRGSFEATWAAEALIHQHPAGRSVIEEAATGGARVSAAAGEALAEFRLAWTQLIGHLGADDKSVRLWREDRALLRAIGDELDTWIADGRDSGFLSLRRWATLNETVRPLRESGLDAFQASLLARTIDPYDAVAAFDRGVAAASLHERFANAGLDRFDASQHQRATDRYIEESGSLREQMRSHLPARLAEQRDPAGHVGALSREVGKARSRLSVRALLDQFGDQIQSLAPCFLMSPDSVARFLTPGRLDFDVVVFDEASQLRVAESIGALGRAKAAIIVGDSRQMPPTSVADTAIADEDEDGPVEGLVVPADEESILSECVAADLPRQWLSWHYRSQDESLIAFSNVHYYDGRLSSFPTPNRADPRRGVHLRRVAGHFERGKERVNRVEAEAVVSEIRRRLRDPDTAEQTIGVVTFNTQQRDLIAGMVERLDDSAVAAALELEAADRLFVKNLENVQGDERDVILFSLGFSTDPITGKLPLNFGPLNRGGGERRLNVAVTRARMLVILFASFSPADIDLSKTGSVGLAHLRTYLEMAELGSDRVADVLVRPPSGRDLHREDVAAALRARGLRVETQVGLSDFTIDIAVGLPDEHDWRVAVLLDGPGWARRSTVADRDGFPLSFLTTAMRWPDVARVWLPSWLVERDVVLDDLERRVRAAAVVEVGDLAVREAADARAGDDAQLSGEGQTADAFDSGHAAEAAVEWEQEFEPMPLLEAEAPSADFATLARPDDVETVEQPAATDVAQAGRELTQPTPPAVPASVFVPAPEPLLGDRFVLDDLSNRENRARVLEALDAAIAAEGPIEVERLVKLVAGQFALNRVRYERISAIKRLLPARTLRNEQLGTYAWPSHLDPSSWNGFRTQSSYLERSLDAIAPQEIVNATLWVLQRRGMSGEWESVLRETVEQFGYNRVTATVRERMLRVRSWATRRGKLVVEGSNIRHP